MIIDKKVKVLFICLSLFIGYGLISQIHAQNHETEVINQSDDINITIDSVTTDENFKAITSMLLEYGIEAKFSNINRNDDDKITGIKIKLVNDNQQVSTQKSSYIPIDKLSFGRKGGKLYVGKDNGLPNMFSMLGGNSSRDNFYKSDSLFSGFSGFDVNEFFNNPNSMFLFNGDSMSIDQIRERMMHNFNFKNSLSNRFSYLFDENYDDTQQTYSFIDNPNQSKVIIIDGEISDFKTLSSLAKNDKLDSVDSLSPKAAVSVYGKEAKDGAIIATTKK